MHMIGTKILYAVCNLRGGDGHLKEVSHVYINIYTYVICETEIHIDYVFT